MWVHPGERDTELEDTQPVLKGQFTKIRKTYRWMWVLLLYPLLSFCFVSIS